MHNIAANAKHLVIPVKLAMHSSIQDINAATDGLNESLRDWLDNSFLADYEFDLKAALHVLSDGEPEEGDLFSTTPQSINVQMHPQSLDGMAVQRVWVVASESLTSSGFDWYRKEDDAIRAFEQEKKSVPIGHTQCSLFAYDVEDGIDAEEITQEIDDFFLTVATTKEFNDSPIVKTYPFTTEAWLDIVERHNQ